MTQNAEGKAATGKGDREDNGRGSFSEDQH